jgi:hypothetical protein
MLLHPAVRCGFKELPDDARNLERACLAMADLLPEEARSVQFLYYGENLPLGFCARNIGIMIDALVVPFTAASPKKLADDKTASEEPKSRWDRRVSRSQRAGDPGHSPTVARRPLPILRRDHGQES